MRSSKLRRSKAEEKTHDFLNSTTCGRQRNGSVDLQIAPISKNLTNFKASLWWFRKFSFRCIGKEEQRTYIAGFSHGPCLGAQITIMSPWRNILPPLLSLSNHQYPQAQMCEGWMTRVVSWQVKGSVSNFQECPLRCNLCCLPYYGFGRAVPNTSWERWSSTNFSLTNSM